MHFSVLSYRPLVPPLSSLPRRRLNYSNSAEDAVSLSVIMTVHSAEMQNAPLYTGWAKKNLTIIESLYDDAERRSISQNVYALYPE